MAVNFKLLSNQKKRRSVRTDLHTLIHTKTYMINQFKISWMKIKKNTKKKSNKVCWKSKKNTQFSKRIKGNVQITSWLDSMGGEQALRSLRMVYPRGCKQNGLAAGRGYNLDFLDLLQLYLFLLPLEFSFS